MNLKEMRLAFEAKVKELNSLLEKGNDITADDYKAIQAKNTEIEDLSAQITALDNQSKSLAAMRAEQQKRNQMLSDPQMPVPHAPVMQKSGEVEISTKGDQMEVLFDGSGGLTNKMRNLIRSDEYGRCFVKYVRAGDIRALSAMEYKTLQEGSDTAGGFTVPEAILLRMVQKKPTPTRVAAFCQTLSTSRDHLTMPRVVWTTDDLYSTGIRATFTGEIPATSTTHRVTDPVFGNIRIPVWTAMLSCPVTQDLLEDSAFGLGDFLASKFTETKELLYDDKILNGTGVNQPSGVLMSPGNTNDDPASTNCGDPITADNLMSFAWSIPEQYDENLRWVMNKTNMAAYIATLKDAQNRYLWGTGLQDSGMSVGGDRMLAGYPVSFSGFMPNRATNAYPAILGDFRGYYLVERVGLSIQVLNEVYAELNQKVILGRLRFGGQVAEPWRIKVVKQA
jgi:HK97 family phage major capsid protein